MTAAQRLPAAENCHTLFAELRDCGITQLLRSNKKLFNIIFFFLRKYLSHFRAYEKEGPTTPARECRIARVDNICASTAKVLCQSTLILTFDISAVPGLGLS